MVSLIIRPFATLLLFLCFLPLPIRGLTFTALFSYPCAPVHLPCRLKEKKVKNVSHDEFGETLGRVHMTRQDLGKLELKKTKSLKVIRKRKAGEMAEDSAAAGGAGDDDDEEGAGAGAAMGGAGGPSKAPAAAPAAKSSGGRSKPSAKRARRGPAAGDSDDE